MTEPLSWARQTVDEYITSVAEIAYTVYGKTTGNKNFQGNEMPGWNELPEKIREAWRNAARAVSMATSMCRQHDVPVSVTYLEAPPFVSYSAVVLEPPREYVQTLDECVEKLDEAAQRLSQAGPHRFRVSVHEEYKNQDLLKVSCSGCTWGYSFIAWRKLTEATGVDYAITTMKEQIERTIIQKSSDPCRGAES